jgi:hypothetical protein
MKFKMAATAAIRIMFTQELYFVLPFLTDMTGSNQAQEVL